MPTLKMKLSDRKTLGYRRNDSLSEEKLRDHLSKLEKDKDFESDKVQNQIKLITNHLKIHSQSLLDPEPLPSSEEISDSSDDDTEKPAPKEETSSYSTSSNSEDESTSGYDTDTETDSGTKDDDNDEELLSDSDAGKGSFEAEESSIECVNTDSDAWKHDSLSKAVIASISTQGFTSDLFVRSEMPLEKERKAHKLYRKMINMLKLSDDKRKPINITGENTRTVLIALSKFMTKNKIFYPSDLMIGDVIMACDIKRTDHCPGNAYLHPKVKNEKDKPSNLKHHTKTKTITVNTKKGKIKKSVPADVEYEYGKLFEVEIEEALIKDSNIEKSKKRFNQFLKLIKEKTSTLSPFTPKDFNKEGKFKIDDEEDATTHDKKSAEYSKILSTCQYLTGFLFLVSILEPARHFCRPEADSEDDELILISSERGYLCDTLPFLTVLPKMIELGLEGKLTFTQMFGSCSHYTSKAQRKEHRSSHNPLSGKEVSGGNLGETINKTIRLDEVDLTFFKTQSKSAHHRSRRPLKHHKRLTDFYGEGDESDYDADDESETKDSKRRARYSSAAAKAHERPKLTSTDTSNKQIKLKR